jgi:hypothetical protein
MFCHLARLVLYTYWRLFNPSVRVERFVRIGRIERFVRIERFERSERFVRGEQFVGTCTLLECASSQGYSVLRSCARRFVTPLNVI